MTLKDWINHWRGPPKSDPPPTEDGSIIMTTITGISALVHHDHLIYQAYRSKAGEGPGIAVEIDDHVLRFHVYADSSDVTDLERMLEETVGYRLAPERTEKEVEEMRKEIRKELCLELAGRMMGSYDS